MEEKNMKTNFIALCAFALSLVALSSCNKADVETVEAQGQEVKFKVFSEETKTYLASGVTNWSSNDIIYVLDQEGKWYNSSKLASGTVVEAEFTFSAFPADPTYALFVGANNSATLGIEEEQVTANLISEQSISNNNSFGKNANLTIGEVVKVDETTYGALLKNVCGLLKFSVPAGITSVKIEGNNSEILSGVVYLDYNEGEPKWTAKDGVNEVTVIPRKSGENYMAGTYYACVLPQTFEEGITVTLTDVNGYTAETKGSNLLALGRNKVVELPNLNVPEAPQQEPTVLEFDFTNATYPDGFSAVENTEYDFDFKSSDGDVYRFNFSANASYSSQNNSLWTSKNYITLPVIEEKSLVSISVTVMNSSQNKQIRLVDSKSSETAISGTNIKVGGDVPTGTITVPSGLEEFYLYINNASTGITKLILTYE